MNEMNWIIIVPIVLGIVTAILLIFTYSSYNSAQTIREEREELQEKRRDVETGIRKALSEGNEISKGDETEREKLAGRIDEFRKKEVAKWKNVIFFGILFASFFILSIVSLIEIFIYSAVKQYGPYLFTLTETTFFLIIAWIVWRIWISYTKVTLKNYGIVLYFDVPDKQVGEGPVFVWFKDVKIPGTDITVSRLIEVKRKEIVFDVHKDKTMLAVSAKSTQPFWLDGYVTWRIKKIVQVIVTTGEETIEGMRDYFEGPEKEIFVENESGDKEKMAVRTGGILDLTFRSFVRDFFRDPDNFDIKDDDSEEEVINKAIGVKENLTKKLHEQFKYLKYFGVELVATEATDIRASKEVEDRLIRARTAAQEIGIATKEKDAVVEKGKSAPELMNFFEQEAGFEISNEIKNVIALLTINSEDLKGVLEGSNLNIALVPAITKLADALGGKETSPANLKNLMGSFLGEAKKDPNGVKELVKEFKKLKIF